MSFLDELNCTTVLEAIKKEKDRIQKDLDNKSNRLVDFRLKL